MNKISAFISDTLEIVLCLYAVIQYLLGKIPFIKELKKVNGVNVIFIFLSVWIGLTIFVILTILLLPFAVYKKSVGAYLKSKYKYDYGGMLEGIDNAWAIETKHSRHIICSVMFVEYNDSTESIMPLIHEVFNEKLVYQFTCIRRRELGYYFRVLNQVTAQDLISNWELPDDALRHKEAFDEALTKINSEPMPLNDTACFQLLVSTKPVTFTTNNNNNETSNIYALLIRIHHSVGDGVALLSFLLKNISDERINVDEEIAKRIVQKQGKKSKNLPSSITSIINTLKRIADLKVYYFAPVEKADENCLHGPKLSGRQFRTSYLEEHPNYVNKIKSIKNRIPGCSFSDVILTAISASFYEYFKQNADEVPKSICLSFILKSFDKNLEYTVTNDGKKEYELGNHFSMGILSLPVQVDVKQPTKALQERLYKIKEESEKIRKSVDILVYYWQLRYFTNLLPVPLLNYVMNINETATGSFSNLPGIESVHIKGYKVRDIVFWVPSVRNIGIGLSILTYDNRFQMGFLVDEILISKHSKAQSVLSSIIKHIDKIDEELNATL